MAWFPRGQDVARRLPLGKETRILCLPVCVATCLLGIKSKLLSVDGIIPISSCVAGS